MPPIPRRCFMNDPKTITESPRRRFLRGAALAATGAATLGFPMVARAQGPISMRWQSTWPQKDIFHEYALDFAKKVNDMTGGDLKIEVLPDGPMATQPLGWYKKPITKADDFKGLKFRTVGISIDVFQGLGAAVNALPGGEIVAAMDRGLLDAAEFT